MFKLKAIDFTGAILTLAASTSLVVSICLEIKSQKNTNMLQQLSLTWAGVQYPWDSAAVIAPLVIGLALLVGFVVWEGKGPKYPLMPRK